MHLQTKLEKIFKKNTTTKHHHNLIGSTVDLELGQPFSKSHLAKFAFTNPERECSNEQWLIHLPLVSTCSLLSVAWAKHIGAMGPLLFALSCCEKWADEDFVIHQKSSGEVLPRGHTGWRQSPSLSHRDCPSHVLFWKKLLKPSNQDMQDLDVLGSWPKGNIASGAFKSPCLLAWAFSFYFA